MTKNPFARTAYLYSGSPWLLWLMAGIQTMLALLFLTVSRHSTPVSPWIGGLTALVALWYYGCLIYYLTHRAQLAANPVKPIIFNAKTVVWTVAITLAVIAVFTVLVLYVWPS
jgi:hypothetical protein